MGNIRLHSAAEGQRVGQQQQQHRSKQPERITRLRIDDAAVHGGARTRREHDADIVLAAQTRSRKWCPLRAFLSRKYTSIHASEFRVLSRFTMKQAVCCDRHSTVVRHQCVDSTSSEPGSRSQAAHERNHVFSKSSRVHFTHPFLFAGFMAHEHDDSRLSSAQIAKLRALG